MITIIMIIILLIGTFIAGIISYIVSIDTKITEFVIPNEYEIIKVMKRRDDVHKYVIKYKNKFLQIDEITIWDRYRLDFYYLSSEDECFRNFRRSYSSSQKQGNLYPTIFDCKDVIITHLKWIKLHNTDYYKD
jgi:hypothetical protein